MTVVASAFDEDLEKILDVAREVTATATVRGTTDEDATKRISAQALHAAATLGMSMGREARIDLMNDLGGPLAIPKGGFPTKQSRLIESPASGAPPDIRLVGLLRDLSSEANSKAAATNIRLAKALICDVFPEAKLSPSLVLATASREWGPSVSNRSTEPIHTYDSGGLDYIALHIKQLGLPQAIVKTWTKADTFVNPESGARKSVVHPAMIPGMHQVLAYAAQTRLSFSNVMEWISTNHGLAHPLKSLSESARRVWQALAFLVPGGDPFTCGNAVQVSFRTAANCYCA